jgi:uncharacterized membrane protein YqiK
MKDILLTYWAGAPMAIWLIAVVVLAFVLVVIAILFVGRIRVEWNGNKRHLIVESNRDGRKDGKKPSST